MLVVCCMGVHFSLRLIDRLKSDSSLIRELPCTLDPSTHLDTSQLYHLQGCDVNVLPNDADPGSPLWNVGGSFLIDFSDQNVYRTASIDGDVGTVSVLATTNDTHIVDSEGGRVGLVRWMPSDDNDYKVSIMEVVPRSASAWECLDSFAAGLYTSETVLVIVAFLNMCAAAGNLFIPRKMPWYLRLLRGFPFAILAFLAFGLYFTLSLYIQRFFAGMICLVLSAVLLVGTKPLQRKDSRNGHSEPLLIDGAEQGNPQQQGNAQHQESNPNYGRNIALALVAGFVVAILANVVVAFVFK